MAAQKQSKVEKLLKLLVNNENEKFAKNVTSWTLRPQPLSKRS